MSIYAANNIAKGVRRLSRRGETGLTGVICNSNGQADFEVRVLSDFAEQIGSSLVHFVPRSPVIQACEVESRTVLEISPDSEEADGFRQLADKVINSGSPVIPTPLEELSELEEMYRTHIGAGK